MLWEFTGGKRWFWLGKYKIKEQSKTAYNVSEWEIPRFQMRRHTEGWRGGYGFAEIGRSYHVHFTSLVDWGKSPKAFERRVEREGGE